MLGLGLQVNGDLKPFNHDKVTLNPVVFPRVIEF
jgi:hypothetical protein